MNLTWHIVKKDLRAFKWPLVLWVLLIVAKLGVGVMLLTSDTTQGKEWFLRMDAFSKILGVLECVSFVLVAAIIQEDMLVGTTAFWQTRPISGARLLRAKLIVIALTFLLVPVVVTLPWWLGCGYGLHEIAWASAEMIVLHAILVLLGLLWSVVTDGFARFLMWTLVTLFAIPTLTGTLIYYVTRGRGGPAGDVMETRVVIGVILGVIGIAVVVIHQFLTRRTWRSIGIIGATSGLIVLMGAFAPWSGHFQDRLNSYLLDRAEGNWPLGAEPAGLKYTLGTTRIYPFDVKKPHQRTQVNENFLVEGLAENQALIPYHSNHAWRWADGTSREGHLFGLATADSMLGEKTLGLVLKNTPASPSGDMMQTRAMVRPEVAEKLLSVAPSYTLEARLRLVQFDPVEIVPQQPGARTIQDALSYRVAAVEREGEQLSVTLVQSHPSLWVDNVAGGGIPSVAFAQYLLANRDRNFADRGRRTEMLSTRIGSVSISWQTMAYHASPKAGGKRPLLEAIKALDDAELVKVTFREQARFTHVFTTDKFEVELVVP